MPVDDLTKEVNKKMEFDPTFRQWWLEKHSNHVKCHYLSSGDYIKRLFKVGKPVNSNLMKLISPGYLQVGYSFGGSLPSNLPSQSDNFYNVETPYQFYDRKLFIYGDIKATLRNTGGGGGWISGDFIPTHYRVEQPDGSYLEGTFEVYPWT